MASTTNRSEIKRSVNISHKKAQKPILSEDSIWALRCRIPEPDSGPGALPRRGTAGHKKSPPPYLKGGRRLRRRPTLPRVTAVPSALAGLTSLFGMGRGGHRRYRHLNIFMLKVAGPKLRATGLSGSCPPLWALRPSNDILLEEGTKEKRTAYFP